MSGGGAARQPAFLTIEQMAERAVSDAGSIAKLAEQLRARLIGAVPKGETATGPSFPTGGALGDLASMIQRTNVLVEDAISDIEAVLSEFPQPENRTAAFKEKIDRLMPKC